MSDREIHPRRGMRFKVSGLTRIQFSFTVSRPAGKTRLSTWLQKCYLILKVKLNVGTSRLAPIFPDMIKKENASCCAQRCWMQISRFSLSDERKAAQIGKAPRQRRSRILYNGGQGHPMCAHKMDSFFFFARKETALFYTENWGFAPLPIPVCSQWPGRPPSS